MVDETEIAQLTLRAANQRQRASQARWLADQVCDALANHQLLQYAQELERQAEDFDVAVAVLKESTEDVRVA